MNTKKSRRRNSPAHVPDIERRYVRRVVREVICWLRPTSPLGAFTASAAGVSLRASHRGWRVLLRRVIFSGKTFEDFLAEFFPDGAPASQSKI